MGFFGRLSIALEPLLCGLVFAAITFGIFAAPRLSPHWVNPDIVIIAPVFGVRCPRVRRVGDRRDARAGPRARRTRCDRSTSSTVTFAIRRRDERSADDTNGYVAVLTDDKTVACEWPTLGQVELPDRARPALCEFSEYGGVHTIDGRATGVLPTRIPALGVAIHGRKEEIV